MGTWPLLIATKRSLNKNSACDYFFFTIQQKRTDVEKSTLKTGYKVEVNVQPTFVALSKD